MCPNLALCHVVRKQFKMLQKISYVNLAAMQKKGTIIAGKVEGRKIWVASFMNLISFNEEGYVSIRGQWLPHPHTQIVCLNRGLRGYFLEIKMY